MDTQTQISWQAWAERNVAHWEKLFDAALRDYMRSGGDISSAGLLKFADAYGRRRLPASITSAPVPLDKAG